MRLMLPVFDAMRRLGRPVSRREIQRVTGFGAAEVKDALQTLRRRCLLVDDDTPPRRRRLYALRPDAERPVDGRGRYSRTDEHRRLQRSLRTTTLAQQVPSYSPARPPSHAAQASALRTQAVTLRLHPPRRKP